MGLVRGMARTAVVAGTATAVSNNVSRRQARRWSEEAAQQQAAQQPEPAPEPAAQAPVAGADGSMAELEKLAELKEKGIITEEEFAAKKKQILGI